MIEIIYESRAKEFGSGDSPLVIDAKKLSALPKQAIAVASARANDGHDAGRQRRREDRYKLRGGVLRHVTSKRRVAACGRCRISASTRVGVTGKAQSDGKRVASFSNVQSCGSVWLCPCCSRKVRVRRGMEIEGAATAHLAGGGGLMMGALTVPHQWGDALASVLKIVKGSFRSAVSGRLWRKDKKEFGIIGLIKTTEVTHGANGWHPHLHILIFTERPLGPRERCDLNERLFLRFAGFVQRAGLSAPLASYNRITPVAQHQAVSRYIAKAVMETSRFDVKQGRSGHRTPFQILYDLGQTGDVHDLNLWHEYENAISGTNSIRWSNGLKARFLVEQKTDTEVAAAEVEGVVVDEVLFDVDEWDLILEHPIAQARILGAMERSGGIGVALVLMDLRQRAHDRDPPSP